MPDDDLKNIDQVLEAKFYQESLDFEDRDRIGSTTNSAPKKS